VLQAAARALDMDLIDMDDEFVKVHGIEISEFVARGSWSAFRELEAQLLVKTCDQRPNGAIIACGGGIVSTSAGVLALSVSMPVVWCRRPINDIINYLESDSARPSIGDIRSVYAEREPMYQQCSTHIFDCGLGHNDEARQHTCDEFCGFLRIVLQGSLQMGRESM